VLGSLPLPSHRFAALTRCDRRRRASECCETAVSVINERATGPQVRLIMDCTVEMPLWGEWRELELRQRRYVGNLGNGQRVRRERLAIPGVDRLAEKSTR
jgi:hypothetical protein